MFRITSTVLHMKLKIMVMENYDYMHFLFIYNLLRDQAFLLDRKTYITHLANF